jgi:hypothetical protein
VVHANSVPDWLVFAAVPLRRRHRIGPGQVFAPRGHA